MSRLFGHAKGIIISTIDNTTVFSGADVPKSLHKCIEYYFHLSATYISVWHVGPIL